MTIQPPILSLEQLDSAAPVMIDEQIRFEVRHLIANLDLTQSAFARAIGYGDGTLSKWKSGQQRLSEGGAKSIDEKGYGPTTLGLNILREASVHSAAAGLPTVRVCEVDDPAQVTGLIRRHKGDLFKTA